MLIRPAQLDDAEPLARVHIQAWQETYRGIMPDAMLDGQSVEERAASWRQRIPHFAKNKQALAVAIDDDGVLIGFAGCGPPRLQEIGTDGEIYAINIVNRGKRNRIGTRLMLAMARQLEQDGFAATGLWVLEQNHPARAFYAALWGTHGASIPHEHGGKTLTDIAILWPRTALLRERCEALLAGSA